MQYYKKTVVRGLHIRSRKKIGIQLNSQSNVRNPFQILFSFAYFHMTPQTFMTTDVQSTICKQLQSLVIPTVVCRRSKNLQDL